MTITCEQILKLLDELDFLGDELISKWKANIKSIPAEFYPLIYHTFSDAQAKIDRLYAEFELSKNDEYKILVEKKMQDAVNLSKAVKLRNISDEIGA